MPLILIFLAFFFVKDSFAEPYTACSTTDGSHYISDTVNQCIVHKCESGKVEGSFNCPDGFAAAERTVSTIIKEICYFRDAKCVLTSKASKETHRLVTKLHLRIKRQVVNETNYRQWQNLMPENGTLTNITDQAECLAACDRAGSACIGFTVDTTSPNGIRCFHLPPEQECVVSYPTTGWIHNRKIKYFASCRNQTTTMGPTTITTPGSTVTPGSTTSISITSSTTTTTTTTATPSTTPSIISGTTTGPTTLTPAPGLPLGYEARFDESHIRGGLLIAVKVNIFKCLELCTNEPLCLSVDYDNRTSSCWLHGGRTYCQKLYRKPYCTHYKKISCYPTDYNSWVEIRPNFHVLGGQLLCSSCDVSTCLRACDRDYSCLGMDYNRHTMGCFKHTSKTACNTLTANDYTTSYRKNACAGLRVQYNSRYSPSKHSSATPGYHRVLDRPGNPNPSDSPGAQENTSGEFVVARLGNKEFVKMQYTSDDGPKSGYQVGRNQAKERAILREGLRSMLLDDLLDSQRNLKPEKLLSNKYGK